MTNFLKPFPFFLASAKHVCKRWMGSGVNKVWMVLTLPSGFAWGSFHEKLFEHRFNSSFQLHVWWLVWQNAKRGSWARDTSNEVRWIRKKWRKKSITYRPSKGLGQFGQGAFFGLFTLYLVNCLTIDLMFCTRWATNSYAQNVMPIGMNLSYSENCLPARKAPGPRPSTL